MIDYKLNIIISNTLKLTNLDLTILFSPEFNTVKHGKVILRVKIRANKTYPQNDICQFRDRKKYPQNIPLKQPKLIQGYM